MKHTLFALSLALVLCIPSVSLAQVTDVDTAAQAASCADISTNLRYRSTDLATSGSVSMLQDFLNARGYLNSEPTGYFGAMTRAAVIAFQKANGISATPPRVCRISNPCKD